MSLMANQGKKRCPGNKTILAIKMNFSFTSDLLSKQMW